MNYDHDIYNSAKRMFIEEGKKPSEISVALGGKPAKSTIVNWAAKEDSTNKNWHQYRQEYIKDSYELATPDAMARKILEKISLILNQSDFTTKDADALAKLQRSLEKITQPRHQVPVMYEMLESFVTFMQKQYPHLINKDLLNAVRDFKNELRKRLAR